MFSDSEIFAIHQRNRARQKASSIAAARVNDVAYLNDIIRQKDEIIAEKDDILEIWYTFEK